MNRTAVLLIGIIGAAFAASLVIAAVVIGTSDPSRGGDRCSTLTSVDDAYTDCLDTKADQSTTATAIGLSAIPIALVGVGALLAMTAMPARVHNTSIHPEQGATT